MNSLPTDVLEERAAEQRRRLHNSVSELRSSVREKLDVKRNVKEYSQEHFMPAVAGVGFVGLVLGYVFAGIFT